MIRIAIDGPAGAGKSTMARLLARELGIDYIDTGAMYRAIALKLLRSGTDHEDPDALQAVLDVTDVDYYGGSVYLDGECVDGFIRTPEVSEVASASSAKLAVREKLVALQKAMGQKRSLVMDGRDIGTNVLTDAEYKFYLDASTAVRAKRRALEMEAKGQAVDLAEVEADIAARDYRDMHREHNPLKQADDAVYVDTSDLSIPEVIDVLKSYIN